MKKAQSSIKNCAGFSAIDILLAGALFAIGVTTYIGAMLYGQEAIALAGKRAKAVFLAQEGLEVVQNIRDADFTSLADGVYGLATTTNQWILSGSQDRTDIFTRSISISSVDAYRRDITSTVNWQQNSQRQGSVTLSSRLTFWQRIVASIGNWANPNVHIGSTNLSGRHDGSKIQVQGSFAYVVRNNGPLDFVIVDISNPALPVQRGGLSIAGTPQNIAVLGNYAYIVSTQNNAEVQIIDISNPDAPVEVGTYNAPGNADAIGVYSVGSKVYVTRVSSANNEFLILDVATPAAPALLGSLDLAAQGNEVTVIGTKAFVAGMSSTQELQVIDVSTSTLPVLAGSLDLPNVAYTLTAFSSTVVIASDFALYTVDVSTSSAPTILGMYNAYGTIQDISLGNSNNYVFLSTASTTAEMQVVNITNAALPSIVGTYDITGSANGIAYDVTSDRALLVTPQDTEELYIVSP